LAAPTPANAQLFSVKLEPGIAIPLTTPQSDIYDIGGGQSLKVLFGLTKWLDIGPAVTFILLPSENETGESGVVWGFGGGIRLKRPHDAKSFYGISPWIDADGFYVRTGELNRPGLDVGLGLSVPIGEARHFWVGPFVRYMHVFQASRDGYDNSDAKILTAGISFEFGSGIDVAERPLPAALPQEVRVVEKEVFVCPDRDKDGLPDGVDHCPDVFGTIDNFGCPVYKKLVVKKDKLELKEKIQFNWNTAELQKDSEPVLDEVVQALLDNKGFKVQVEGHASSEGGDDHNQDLSDRRATAVLDYLAAHGVAKDRLVSRGFSSSVPIDTNDTQHGRENNRRVEFVVDFIIINDGGVK